jgi:hypothetical protein
MKRIKLLTAALVALAGCGSGGGGYYGGNNSDGGPRGNGNGSCVSRITGGGNACDTCVLANCGSQWSACVGPAWTSGTFSGPCASTLNCYCACAQTDTACQNACFTSTPATCQSCLTPALSCQQSQCSSQCRNSGGTPDLSMLSPNCQSLQGCCQFLTPSDQSLCTSLVSENNDSLCLNFLSMKCG